MRQFRSEWRAPRAARGWRGLFAAITAAGVVASAAAAAEAERPPTAPGGEAAAPLSAQLVKTGLYLISGGGSNSVLRFSAAGSLLVDGKLPGQYRGLMSQVRRISKISDLPLRVVVVTDHHIHHSGNDAQFLAARVPVIAHQNTQARLPPEQFPAAGQALRSSYVDERTLQFGGVEVQLLHFGKAQTDDATVVYFADLRAIAVGDLFTPSAAQPDYAGGGSLVGWSAFLGDVLKLDFDVVIPSQGPTVGKAELRGLKDRIDTLVARADGLSRQGLDKDRFMAQLQVQDLGWSQAWVAEHFEAFYSDVALARGTRAGG